MRAAVWGAVLLTGAILLAAAVLATTVLAVATGEGCR